MNTLMADKVKSNCSFLLKLNENDNIKASRGLNLWKMTIMFK